MVGSETYVSILDGGRGKGRAGCSGAKSPRTISDGSREKKKKKKKRKKQKNKRGLPYVPLFGGSISPVIVAGRTKQICICPCSGRKALWSGSVLNRQHLRNPTRSRATYN